MGALSNRSRQKIGGFSFAPVCRSVQRRLHHLCQRPDRHGRFRTRQRDRVPNYTRQSSVRDAHLTVIDPKTGQNLWTDSHVWGGLLTGANSVGERLVKKLEKQVEK